MKQTKADLLIEIGKLTQLVEEIRDRLVRLEAKAPYTPYRPWPYHPWYGSKSDEPSIPPTWTSSGTNLDLSNLKPGKMEWEPDYQETGTVTEGRFKKDGSFEAMPKNDG